MEEVLRQPDVDCVTWLAITIVQVYNKKEQVEQRYTKPTVWGQKGPRKLNAGAKACAGREKEVRERTSLY